MRLRGTDGLLRSTLTDDSYDCNDLKFHSPTGVFSPQHFFEYLKAAFDVLYEEGLSGKPKMMTIGLHCRITGKPARFLALKQFIEYICSKPTGHVWTCKRRDIAAHWREKVSPNHSLSTAPRADASCAPSIPTAKPPRK